MLISCVRPVGTAQCRFINAIDAAAIAIKALADSFAIQQFLHRSFIDRHTRVSHITELAAVAGYACDAFGALSGDGAVTMSASRATAPLPRSRTSTGLRSIPATSAA